MVEKLNDQNWWSNQDKNIGNIKQQTQEVICRVFSRRHGITKVEEQYWTDEKQMPNILMGINGKQEMERLAEEMLASGCNAEDAVIVYSPKDEEGNKVRRIIQSKNILQSKLQCAAIETNLLNTWVKIQDEEGKIDNKDDRIVGKLKHAADVAELARHEILGAFNGKWWEYDKYKNIILLSHKSNEPWLDIISTPEAKTVTLSKHKEKRNHDDDIIRDENGKAEYKNYKDEKDILQITNENKEEMMRCFESDNGLYDEICRCEEKRCNVFELQNSVNRYFNEHQELYERYLVSENEELRIFCLAKLIDVKKYDILSDIYLKNIYPLSEWEKEILLKNKSITEVNILITQHFIDKRSLRKEEESELFKKHWLDSYYNELKEKYEIDKTVKWIQNKSLDKKIKEHKKWSILQREISKIIEKKDSQGNIIYKQEKIEIDMIVQWLQNKKKYILPAHVGSGKSIWLSDIAKKLSYNNTLLLIEWCEIKDYKKREEIKNKVSENHNIILCIDAIDEISDDNIKQQIKKDIFEIDSWMLVTGRLSEYDNKTNGGFETLEMKGLDKEVFIVSRIQEENKRNMVRKILETSNLAWEIEGNPLLLNFVCILANEEENFQNIGINKLEDIKNKSDLYENIVKLILYKHQKDTHSDNFIKDNVIVGINEYMDVAWKFAYNTYIDKYKLSHLKKKEIRMSDLSNMNILFKRNANADTNVHTNANYSFIHKSFEEFFLARYLANQSDGDKEIYRIRDEVAGEENRNEWKNFKPVVDFYWEILINNDCINNSIDKLEDFLWEEWLLKNDDALWYNFALWINFLSKIEKNKRETYMQKTLNLYQNIIEKHWEKEIILSKIFFMRNILKGDCFDFLSDMLYECSTKRRNNILLYIAFAERGNGKALDILYNEIEKIFQKDSDKYTEREYDVKKICRKLIEIKNKSIINKLFLLANKLSGAGEYEKALVIYNELNRDNVSLYKKYIFVCIDKLIEWKKYFEAGKCIEKLTEDSNKEIVDRLLYYTNKICKKKKHFLLDNIYVWLSKLKKRKSELDYEKEIKDKLKNANEWLEKLRNNKEKKWMASEGVWMISEVKYMYIDLIKLNIQDAMYGAFELANIFSKKWTAAGEMDLYIALARSKNDIGVKLASQWALGFLDRCMYYYAGSVYALIDDPNATEKAIECMNKITHSIDRWSIYQDLIKLNNPRAKEFILKNAENSRDTHSFETHIVLAKDWKKKYITIVANMCNWRFQLSKEAAHIKNKSWCNAPWWHAHVDAINIINNISNHDKEDIYFKDGWYF